MMAMREPGFWTPNHATSSAPVLVFPQPLPARASQIGQSPGGVSWSGRANCIHCDRAVTAARNGGGSFFKSAGDSCEGVVSVNIQHRPDGNRLFGERVAELAEIPAARIEREPALDRVCCLDRFANRLLGEVVKPDFASLQNAAGKLVVVALPSLDGPTGRHAWILADFGKALALSELVEQLLDDVVCEFAIGHAPSLVVRRDGHP